MKTMAEQGEHLANAMLPKRAVGFARVQRWMEFQQMVEHFKSENVALVVVRAGIPARLVGWNMEYCVTVELF